LNFDLFPTFVHLAGGQLPADLDAVDLTPLLQQPTLPAERIKAQRELYFLRREGGFAYGGKSYEAMIRWPWKLLQNGPYEPLELYNLAEDPAEEKNLVNERKGIANELSAAIRRHIQRAGAIPWQPTGDRAPVNAAHQPPAKQGG
jgi:arylsulfatase A-like enzyme